MTTLKKFLAKLHKDECQSSQEEHPMAHQAHRIIEQLAALVMEECSGHSLDILCPQKILIDAIVEKVCK